MHEGLIPEENSQLSSEDSDDNRRKNKRSSMLGYDAQGHYLHHQTMQKGGSNIHTQSLVQPSYYNPFASAVAIS